MIYLQLLLSFMQIGLMSFGGGYAAMSLIQSQVVAMHGWISPEVFADLVTISEMTPGPVAINAATFVGMRVAGVPGALVATLGYVLPACAAAALLAWVYGRYRKNVVVGGLLEGIRPAVLALVALSAITLTRTALHGGDTLALVALAAGFLALRMKWIKPMPLLGLAAAIGLAAYGIGTLT